MIDLVVNSGEMRMFATTWWIKLIAWIWADRLWSASKWGTKHQQIQLLGIFLRYFFGCWKNTQTAMIMTGKSRWFSRLQTWKSSISNHKLSVVLPIFSQMFRWFPGPTGLWLQSEFQASGAISQRLPGELSEFSKLEVSTSKRWGFHKTWGYP